MLTLIARPPTSACRQDSVTRRGGPAWRILSRKTPPGLVYILVYWQASSMF